MPSRAAIDEPRSAATNGSLRIELGDAAAGIRTMITATDFRRMALSMKGAMEGAHMGHPDFRAGGRIFATLHPDNEWAMVKLTPEQQRVFVVGDSESFKPENGAWGRQGCTAVRLAAVNQDSLAEAITLAWQNAVATTPSSRKRRPKQTSR